MHLIYPDTAQFRAFRQISGVLKRAGFAVYAVGGAVRDLCLGKTPQDVDIATSAQPEELEKLFCDLKWVGRSFGVSLVKAGDFEFEVATFREERSYADGRHPEKLSFSRSPETDVRRRDFTVNALLADPWSGEVLDFTGGLNDLQMGIIRTVGDPETRFNEDHLRMLRALRFANRLGFELEESTFAALKRLAHLSSGIAGERVRQELENGFSCRPDRFLRLLDASGILEYILPEISHLKQVEQHQLYHPEGNVFNHTCKMLEHACGADTVLLWSILLHDIGKAETSFVDENGYVRAFGHECRGAEMAQQILERLRFSKLQSSRIVKLVAEHMSLAMAPKMRQGKLRRLMQEEDFHLALELHRLDCISSHGMLDCWCFILDEYAKIPSPAEKVPALIDGKKLISLGGTPGPHFKAVLSELYELQLAGEFTQMADAEKKARELLEKSKV